ncbi:MAG: hypothetical protein PHY00_01685 [Bacilli bacterium]|nr:hypothetical protein [Bacilli bacterium]
MDFNHKDYINNKITKENCNHEVLLGNGHDEGEYGFGYECIICKEHFRIFHMQNFSLDNKFIKYHYGSLTPGIKEVMVDVLNGICFKFKHEESIDIENLFKEFDSFIDAEVENNLIEKFGIDKNPKILKYNKNNSNN